MVKTPLRNVKLWDPHVTMESRADGSFIIRREDPIGEYPPRMTDRLEHWARVAPDRTWLAEREAIGAEGWRRVSFAEGLERVRRIGQAVLDLGLSLERPLLILSGNSVAHGLMAVGAQYVGVPSAAISPAYSLVSSDYAKLRDIVRQLTPGLVFVDNGARFQKAIDAVLPPDIPVVSVEDPVTGRPAIAYDAFGAEPGAAVEAAHAAVGPDTIAKFLFTSGTTGSPKAVIQTQRMMCSNQEMVVDCYEFMREEPPVMIDWAPWNHTAAGNKVFNIAIYNGGSYYLDGGKPSPSGIKETIRNLREISPTWYFNVPIGYEMLVDAMEEDLALRESFFAHLKMAMYAGAGMAQHTWDRLGELSVETIGERVLLCTGLGSTETAPFALFCTEAQLSPGNVGVPSQGVELKLTPNGGKLEARLKGPNVTPGYWRAPELTAKAFDEEGYYLLGDALRFAEPGDASKGFFFDGRIAENFKLRTGTWVSVGAVRAALVDQLGGIARDAVLAGENQDELGALLLPYAPALRALAPGLARLSDAELFAHPVVRAEFETRLSRHAAAATGSASRVTRALLLTEEPSLDKGEVTDKGSINQRAVLRHRADLVAALYDDADPRVMRVRKVEA